MSAVYDPIGLVAPNTATARLLLEDVWRRTGQQWDNNLPDDSGKKFLEWVEELLNLNKVTIPRCYFRETMESVELYVVGDSSQDVFFAVAFLRARLSLNGRTKTQVAFVFGKSRIAPKKALTIPKLELQAALLAARLKDKIQQPLTIPFKRTFMWTDRTNLLQWLQSIDKFLMTPDWPFQPSEEILKIKLKNIDSIEVNTKPVYSEITAANTASVTFNILTLEWQMYRSYVNFCVLRKLLL